MPLADAAHLVVAMMAMTMGLSGWLPDLRDHINRSLPLCVVLIGMEQAL